MFYNKGGPMPPINRQFSLALEALAELKSETKSLPLRGTPLPAAPDLDNVLTEIGPLPREALLLGVASDGLPVLLNLYDPLPGPILIAGDPGSGKTAFLQTIMESARRTHQPDAMQIAVIARHTDEWDKLSGSPLLTGIFPPGHNGAQDMILSLTSWAHSNERGRQSVLLLIDDLESMTKMDFEAVQQLRWLLLRGPSHRVWLFVTLNAARYGEVIPWLPSFRTRLFGRIAEERVAGALGADKASGVDRLEARIQFSLRENGNWIQFWLPSCPALC
jgi:hypothetical protein